MTPNGSIIPTCGVDTLIGELLARLEVAREGAEVLAEIETALDRGVPFVHASRTRGGHVIFTPSPMLTALIDAARADRCTLAFARTALQDSDPQRASGDLR